MSINASNNPYPDSPDASPTKLDKGGYDGTAETLDNKIDEILAEAKILINNTLVGSASLGSIVPSSVPPATGAVHAFATQAGTYTNWGGYVIPANTFALISRSSNLVFSISQTALDVSGKVNVSDVINTLASTETAKPLSANQGRVLDLKIAQGIVNWTAKAFLINDEVSHLGKLWQANAAIISTDVPGTSSKWVEVLSGYGLKSDVFIYSSSKNKYSKTNHNIVDFWVNSSNIIEASAGKIMCKIPVKSSTTYTFKRLLDYYSLAAFGGFLQLDKDSNIIVSSDPSTFASSTIGGGKTFTTNANTAFIVTNIKVGATDNTNLFQFEEGGNVNTYEAYVANVDRIRGISVIPDSVLKKSDVFIYSSSKNKYSKTNHNIVDFWVNSSNIIEASAGKIMCKIPVKSSTTYTFKRLLDYYSLAAFGGFLQLDKDSNIIVSSDPSTFASSTIGGGKTFTTNANTAFIVTNIKVGATDNTNLFQFEEGGNVNTYEAYVANVDSILSNALNSVSSNISSNVSITTSDSINRFDKIKGTLLNYKIGTASEGFIYELNAQSSKIEVLPNTAYSFYNKSNLYLPNQIGKMLLLDESESIISIIDMSTLPNALVGTGKTVTTGATTKFVSILMRNSANTYNQLNEFKFELGTSVTAYTGYSKVISKINGLEVAPISEAFKVYENENIVFMGDSMVADESGKISWTYHTLSRLQFANSLNLAVSGAKWAHTSSTVYDITPQISNNIHPNNCIWNQVNVLIYKVANSLTPTPTTVVIQAGTNDFNQTGTPFPVGDPDAVAVNINFLTLAQNATLVQSVAGGMRYAIDTLLLNFPNIQIIIVSPLQNAGGSITTQFITYNTIQKMAGYLSCDTINATEKSGIYWAYEQTYPRKYTYDGTHLTELGRKKVGFFMAQELSKIIVKK